MGCCSSASTTTKCTPCGWCSTRSSAPPTSSPCSPGSRGPHARTTPTSACSMNTWWPTRGAGVRRNAGSPPPMNRCGGPCPALPPTRWRCGQAATTTRTMIRAGPGKPTPSTPPTCARRSPTRSPTRSPARCTGRRRAAAGAPGRSASRRCRPRAASCLDAAAAPGPSSRYSWAKSSGTERWPPPGWTAPPSAPPAAAPGNCRRCSAPGCRSSTPSPPSCCDFCCGWPPAPVIW